MDNIQKTIYFVRHGATPLNEARTYQFSDTPLSEKGLKQAMLVAERFKTISVDVVISSQMKRALQTSGMIAEASSRPLVESPLLHEMLRPSAIHGRPHADPEAVEIFTQTVADFENTERRHSDEENFFDIKKRALELLTFLKEREEKNIVAVTHGTFLHMIMATMMEGEEVQARTFHNFQKFLYPSNTGITRCVLRNDVWRLLVWSDDAHLGSL
ncbi:histidine phosphatase family protein [Patescibacteria group bacterium]|nr:MAG: histidine phosphatase family protein [Patescibacteria group bacterium]